MSLGRKEEIKEEENEFFGKLGRQNQGETHESKMIAKGKEKRRKEAERRLGRALGAPSILSFHPMGSPRKQCLRFRLIGGKTSTLKGWETAQGHRAKCQSQDSQRSSTGIWALAGSRQPLGNKDGAGRVEARPGAGARRGGGGADAIITSLNKSASSGARPEVFPSPSLGIETRSEQPWAPGRGEAPYP